MPSIDLKDQYFGCEIEMTGLTRQQAAEAVAALFGTTARQTHESRTYDPWEVTDNEGRIWRFVYDSSIHGSHRIGRQQVPIGDGTYKVEMNSPKLEYSGMGKLQEVVRTLRHAGGCCQWKLRYARSCRCFQAYSQEPEKCPFHYVFQRGYPVQSLKCE